MNVVRIERTMKLPYMLDAWRLSHNLKAGSTAAFARAVRNDRDRGAHGRRQLGGDVRAMMGNLQDINWAEAAHGAGKRVLDIRCQVTEV